MVSLLSIGGTAMPPPYKYDIAREDIDSESSGRSETGVMFRDRIRQGVYKLSLGWKVYTPQLEDIISAISAENFSVTFFDGTSAGNKTRTMYAGTPNVTMILNAPTMAEVLWDITMNLIEV